MGSTPDEMPEPAAPVSGPPTSFTKTADEFARMNPAYPALGPKDGGLPQQQEPLAKRMAGAIAGFPWRDRVQGEG